MSKRKANFPLERIKVLKRCPNGQQEYKCDVGSDSEDDENKFYPGDDDDVTEAGKWNGCSFWLGKETSLCSRILFNQIVVTYNKNHKDDIVSAFIASLVTDNIKKSYLSFKKKVKAFADENHIEPLELASTIHENYWLKDGFMDYIGADRFLWYLTGSMCTPWDEVSGPSYVFDNCNLKADEKGVDRALRTFMNVSYQPSYRQDNIVQYWTNTELVFGNAFNSLIPANVFPNGLKKITFGDGYDGTMSYGTKFLPDDLQELMFTGNDCMLSVCILPSNLITLSAPNSSLSMKTCSMVPGLKTLHVKELYDSVSKSDSFPGELILVNYTGWIVPNGLKRMELQNGPLPKTLPFSLSELVFHGDDESLGEYVFPSELKRLELTNFNQPLENALPSGLEHLVLPAFRHTFENNILPKTLRTINVYGRFWYKRPDVEFKDFVARIRQN